MSKFKRTGPSVDVPALGLVGVETGQEVEVSDPTVAASLSDQKKVWAPVRPAKTAAEKKSEER